MGSGYGISSGQDGEDVGGKYQHEVKAGAGFVLRTGRGLGDTFQRDPEKIGWDVLEGVLNLERIRRIYGIVIDPAAMTVDGPGTKELRANQPRSTAD